MQYSVVNYGMVKKSETLRFDAEYFRNDYLYNIYLIERKKHQFVNLEKLKIKCDASAFYPALEPYYGKGDTPFIRVADVDNGIKYEQSLTIPKEILDIYKTLYLAKKGDIVLTKGGSIARAGLITKESALTRDLIFFNTSKLDEIEYIFYYTYCLTNFYKKQLVQSSSMTAQPHLTITLVKNIPFFNPSTDFKKYITNIVKKSFGLSENSKSLYSQAEQLLLSELGLLHWKPKHQLSFIKNYSEAQKVDRIDAEYFQPKYEEIVEAFKKYNGGFDILENLTTIKKCIEPGSEAYEEKGIPFIRVSNLSKFGINSDNQQFISEKKYEELKKHQPQKYEILLSKDATPGIAYFLRMDIGKAIPSGGILRVKIKNQNIILPEFLTLVLNSEVVQKQIERDAGGSIINHWRIDQVNSTLIPLFPLKLQKEISQKIDGSFTAREQSKSLLEIAKRGVEMAIEENEEKAEEWMKSQIKDLKIDLV